MAGSNIQQSSQFSDKEGHIYTESSKNEIQMEVRNLFLSKEPRKSESVYSF